MVKIKGKIKPLGNSYYILVPKALIDCKVLPLDTEVEFETDIDAFPAKSIHIRNYTLPIHHDNNLTANSYC